MTGNAYAQTEMKSNFNWKLVVEIIGGILFVMLVAWFFFFRSTPELTPTETPQQTGSFNSQTSVGANSVVGSTNANEAIPSPVSQQKVFKISDGPIAGATFMQELRPTTTIARFVKQENGHVLDLAIDSPGSVARASSNTTIPGVARVAWELQQDAGRTRAAGATMQYIEGSTIKTVLLNFPLASTTSSTPAPVRIQFLPNDIIDIVASPDGRSLAYLLAAPGGVDGYVARADGTNTTRLFSLPLSQVLLSWPTQSTLMVTSKAATGLAGIAFSVNATTGATAPILYAPGLTTTADSFFSQVVYQSATENARTTYTHDTKTNLDRPLSFDPIPEKCAWSRTQVSVMYCAVSLSYLPTNYIDLLHQGTGSSIDSIVVFNLATGLTAILANPGGAEGGEASDITNLTISQDDKYLLFIKKGERSLWGVRLY
ncbi:MAG: Protein TolB [Candidatus Adlerbacteria bacterium]|nr:Protein TolB [Candidatus Adlerbacteria bacterium]